MRRLAAVLLAFAALAAGSVAAPSSAVATEGGVFVGTCVFNASLRATYSPALTAVPTARTIGLDGTGTCVVNGATGIVSVGGGVTSIGPFGCHEGAALGGVSLSFSVPGFNRAFGNVTLAVVNTGGVMTVAATYQGVRLAGAGPFVQDPLKTVQCTTGSVTSANWTGALVFEDPEPPAEGG